MIHRVVVRAALACCVALGCAGCDPVVSFDAGGDAGSDAPTNRDQGTVDAPSNVLNGSCAQSVNSQCTDYFDHAADDVSALRNRCSSISGVWSDTACPRTGVVGGCRENLPDSRAYLIVWYSGAGLTVADVQNTCMTGGTTFVMP